MTEGEQTRIKRRDVIKGAAASLASGAINVPEDPQGKLEEFFEKAELRLYLNQIGPQVRQITAAFKDHNPFIGCKYFTQSQLLEDLKIYGPIYLAAQQKFSAPWFELWTVHAVESAISRDLDLETPNLTGSMQRNYTLHSYEKVKAAAEGWKFLRQYPNQRLLRSKGGKTDDWEEILWAASFLREKADSIQQRFSENSSLDSVLYALKYYVDTNVAEEEIGLCRKVNTFLKGKGIKTLFE